MELQVAKSAKKVGRPATGQGTQVVVRCQEALLTALDDWRSRQRPIPTRAEAIRQLTEASLNSSKRGK